MNFKFSFQHKPLYVAMVLCFALVWNGNTDSEACKSTLFPSYFALRRGFGLVQHCSMWAVGHHGVSTTTLCPTTPEAAASAVLQVTLCAFSAQEKCVAVFNKAGGIVCFFISLSPKVLYSKPRSIQQAFGEEGERLRILSVRQKRRLQSQKQNEKAASKAENSPCKKAVVLEVWSNLCFTYLFHKLFTYFCAALLKGSRDCNRN